MEHFSSFITDGKTWIATSRRQHQEDDSVSVAATPAERKSAVKSTTSSASCRCSRSSKVSISSVRQKEQAERAALLARAASLKQRQALDIKECKLKENKEQLEIAIAASTSKIQVLENSEYDNCKGDVGIHPETVLPGMPQLRNQQPMVNYEHIGQLKADDLQVKHETDTQQSYVNRSNVETK